MLLPFHLSSFNKCSVVGLTMAALAVAAFSARDIAAMPSMLEPHPGLHVEGAWQLGEIASYDPADAFADTEVKKGTFGLEEGKNGEFTGNGVDGHGSFTITGRCLDDNKIEFSKEYIPDGHNHKPIKFVGQIDWVRPADDTQIPYNMHAYGIWVDTQSHGYGWRAHCDTGKWEAGMTLATPR